MAKPINREQRIERIRTFLYLLERYPECIRVDIKKMVELSNLNKQNYQLIRRVYNDIKNNISFRYYFKDDEQMRLPRKFDSEDPLLTDKELAIKYRCTEQYIRYLKRREKEVFVQTNADKT